MKTRVFCLLCLSLFMFACGSAEPEPTSSAGEETVEESHTGNGSEPPPGFPPAHAERPEMSADECAEANAEVVGDIGDGRTHRPDYLCPSGAEPIGTVPVGIEGAVCCPR